MIEYTVKVTANTTEWHLNGKLHREDGPAVSNTTEGFQQWFLNGNLHRDDGPAVEWVSGLRSWYIHGERHREDGPAVINDEGKEAWYLNGVKVTEAEVMSPAKELTVGEIEQLLGHKVKVIK